MKPEKLEVGMAVVGPVSVTYAGLQITFQSTIKQEHAWQNPWDQTTIE